jgi:hypothetical protein
MRVVVDFHQFGRRAEWLRLAQQSVVSGLADAAFWAAGQTAPWCTPRENISWIRRSAIRRDALGRRSRLPGRHPWMTRRLH